MLSLCPIYPCLNSIHFSALENKHQHSNLCIKTSPVKAKTPLFFKCIYHEFIMLDNFFWGFYQVCNLMFSRLPALTQFSNYTMKNAKHLINVVLIVANSWLLLGLEENQIGENGNILHSSSLGAGRCWAVYLQLFLLDVLFFFFLWSYQITSKFPDFCLIVPANVVKLLPDEWCSPPKWNIWAAITEGFYFILRWQSPANFIWHFLQPIICEQRVLFL